MDRDLSSTLVIHAGALGDFLLTHHVLACLRTANPGLRIDVLARSPLARWTAGRGVIDTAHDYESSGLEQLFTARPDRQSTLAERLSGYDLVISFLGGEQCAPGRALAQLFPNTLCIDPAPDQATITQCRHITAQWLEALALNAAGWDGDTRSGSPCLRLRRKHATPRLRRAWSCHPADTAPQPLQHEADSHAPSLLRVGDDERRFARERLSAMLESPCGAFVVIHPGSGSRAKCCPIDKLQPVVTALQDRGCGVAWMVGPTEVDWYGPDWVTSLRRVAPVIYEQDVCAAAAWLCGADAYVGHDAGMTHVAAALGIPTVALFGPTDPCMWAPLGPHVRSIACGATFECFDAAEVLHALQSLQPCST